MIKKDFDGLEVYLCDNCGAGIEGKFFVTDVEPLNLYCSNDCVVEAYLPLIKSVSVNDLESYIKYIKST